MDVVDITVDAISVEQLTQRVSSPSCGAISSFLGTTRDNFKGKKVTQLEYEAYEPMARKEMLKICAQVRERWRVENIAIVHRIGVVPVMEASVAIVVSSPHRRESLEAVQYAIDTLKASVPIWKKEWYEDGTCSWKENSECCGPKKSNPA
ncbi:molybdopterin synthase catalytic subunit-like [Mya arenaria]|uniref:molybdopterin synthase catalytic subunit-like n=1 Tax=Mya arenaria TaxID=6604 RepID=UPI0022E1737D|nr:molybdopterin synthase catalytic subunit-like [Mya arenaria]